MKLLPYLITAAIFLWLASKKDASQSLSNQLDIFGSYRFLKSIIPDFGIYMIRGILISFAIALIIVGLANEVF